MPISLCTDLDRKFVEYVVDSNNNSSSNACLSSKTNAFDTLMQSQKKLHLPSKIMKVSMMGPEKLYNDIIDWIAPIDNGWTLDQKEIGSKIISTLRNALWYIDHAHEKFKERGYLKEFLVQYRQHALFVCMDDKAVVPIGEPGIPISTGVRGHNKVMAPASGPALVATDHDFHNAGIIPLVAFVSDIPVNPNDSFFQGKIYVTVKDKTFQHSTPFRHATELLRIIRNNYSDEGVDLDVPILCLMTDGGSDHRLTYETVKASVVLLFMQADLDMLIAIRTAPN
ncbi:hypothetical protein FSP39_007105 [Pinctada imbricata]|uniref:Uncharacterized protein n=1 Tax=Pinctada imbricata TaxID=66713 RepID=A0AA88YN92_PINIB|nr:hypothetical protein FSP39_007105 [Pinctada imbricata]